MSWPKRWLIALLASCALYGSAQAAEQGVLRGVDTGRGEVMIDEIRYRTSPLLKINNLAEGFNRLQYAIVGQPVRYTFDSGGLIDELWLYPLRADERQKLGIQLVGEIQ